MAEGEGKSFYESGSLEIIENYKHGNLEGLVQNFNKNGQLQLERTFHMGKQVNVLKVLPKDGHKQ